MRYNKFRQMKKIKIFFLLLVIACGTVGCIYDFIAPEETVPIDPTVKVSFATQIAPIFNTSDNCTVCHRAGNQAPDLTTSNAYNSINNSKYLNLTTPAESVIYKVPSPGSTVHSHKTYTATQAALVLTWIQQGAKNN
jgi:hypothetical protein